MFQSTRPHGARLIAHGNSGTRIQFQSTRPHGARHKLQHVQGLNPSFNPRAHTERDTYPRQRQRPKRRFQSTRPHGARQYIQQTPEYLYSKLHFLRDMANIHAKLFLLSPTITNYLKLKHCESIAI